jgi:hypothetical protein
LTARLLQLDANNLPQVLQIHILREQRRPCRHATAAIMQIYNTVETDAP